MIQKLLQTIKTKDPYLIAIAGIPGSGKSTISQTLHQMLPNSIVVPMDGYHLYRNQLDEEGMKFRGAAFTFNKQKFKNDIRSMKENKFGKFPSFDHKKKDPVQDAIEVATEHKHIIVQGLYLFYEDWGMNDVWDLKVWIQCDPQVAIKRVIKRNFEAGIYQSLEQASERVNANDRKNLKQILLKSSMEDVIMINNTN